MIAFLIAQLSGATAVPPPPKRGSLATIFSYYDYPAEALANGWEGDVIIGVHVGADGRVHSCRIVKSSGYGVLDVQTCAIMLGRSRFVPARDVKGHSVPDDVVLPAVRWRLPTPEQPTAEEGEAK
jgi:protein TonB